MLNVDLLDWHLSLLALAFALALAFTFAFALALALAFVFVTNVETLRCVAVKPFWGWVETPYPTTITTYCHCRRCCFARLLSPPSRRMKSWCCYPLALVCRRRVSCVGNKFCWHFHADHCFAQMLLHCVVHCWWWCWRWCITQAQHCW